MWDDIRQFFNSWFVTVCKCARTIQNVQNTLRYTSTGRTCDMYARCLVRQLACVICIQQQHYRHRALIYWHRTNLNFKNNFIHTLGLSITFLYLYWIVYCIVYVNICLTLLYIFHYYVPGTVQVGWPRHALLPKTRLINVVQKKK